MRKQFRFMFILVAIALSFTLCTENILAKGGSRSSSSRSSSSRSSSSRSSRSVSRPRTTTTKSTSGGYGSSKAKTTRSAETKSLAAAREKRAAEAKAAAAKKTTGGYGSSKATTAKKTTTTTVAKKTTGGWGSSAKQTKAQTKKDAAAFKNIKKTPAYSKADQQLKATVGKSGKTYTNRSQAEQSLRTKAYNKQYAAGSPRPDFIPRSYMVGGVGYNTILVGNYWGYYGPGNIFVRMPMTGYVFSNAHLAAWGYNPVVRPVYTTGWFWMWFIAGCVVLSMVGYGLSRADLTE